VGLKALVVDDEPFARADLRGFMEDERSFEVVWEAGSIAEARRLLGHKELDVVFLDVQLREGYGFDLMVYIQECTQVVFVTAYDQYALRAFEVNALDYLLKPVSTDRFRRCLNRVKERFGLASDSFVPTRVALDDRILVRSGSRREFVAVCDVVVVTSMGGNYTQICKSDGSWLDVRRTMKQWEAMLPPAQFVRVHRATIVNLDHVQGVARHPGGRVQLRVGHLSDPVEVSRRSAPNLGELLGQLRWTA
jgi:two-component system LytT family response regulator